VIAVVELNRDTSRVWHASCVEECWLPGNDINACLSFFSRCFFSRCNESLVATCRNASHSPSQTSRKYFMTPHERRPCPLTIRLAQDLKIRNMSQRTIASFEESNTQACVVEGADTLGRSMSGVVRGDRVRRVLCLVRA
jgi:Trp operon repressor